MNNRLFQRVLDDVNDVRGAALALLLVLSGYADGGGASWLKPTTLADRAHLTPRQLERQLAKLRDASLVCVEPPLRPGWPDTLRVVIADVEGEQQPASLAGRDLDGIPDE